MGAFWVANLDLYEGAREEAQHRAPELAQRVQRQGIEASSCSFTTPLGSRTSPSSKAEDPPQWSGTPPPTGGEAKIIRSPAQMCEVICFCQQLQDVGPRLYHKIYNKTWGGFLFFFLLFLTLHLLLPISTHFLQTLLKYLPQSNCNKSKAV